MRILGIAATLCLCALLLGRSETASATHRTPGGNTVIAYTPYAWKHVNAASEFIGTWSILHHYSFFWASQNAAPAPGPTFGISVPDIHAHFQNPDLGAMYLNAHGNLFHVDVQPYAPGPTGEALRMADWTALNLLGYDFPQITFTTGDDGPGIAVRHRFFKDQTTITSKPLIHLSTCGGFPGVTDEIIAAGALSATGYV